MDDLIKILDGVRYIPCGRYDSFKEAFGGMSLNWSARQPYLVQYVAEDDVSRHVPGRKLYRTFNWGYMYEYVTVEDLDWLWEMTISEGCPTGGSYSLIPIYSLESYNKICATRSQQIQRESEMDMIMCKSGVNLLGIGTDGTYADGEPVLVKGKDR